jgi:protein-L-isoaspartate(D-aspartate) O-methyltransferase
VQDLVTYLEKTGKLRTSHIQDAFRAIDRAHFVPDNLQDQAYIDGPLPIDAMQTISAPHMVAMMLELSQIQPGDHILEIGTGSGYNAALCGYLAGPQGRVDTIERIGTLYKKVQKSLGLSHSDNVFCHFSDGLLGLEAHAPYQIILATCVVSKVPETWKQQITQPDGKIICPVQLADGKQTLFLFQYNQEGSLISKDCGGVAFVPCLPGTTQD